MVDAAWSQSHLRDFKAPAFTEQHVFFRYADVVKVNVHVTMRGIVVAENLHSFEDVHALGIDRHEDLRLLLVDRRVGVSLNHGDHDFAARIAGT